VLATGRCQWFKPLSRFAFDGQSLNDTPKKNGSAKGGKGEAVMSWASGMRFTGQPQT
jgi:hypothetical protein